MDDPERRTLSGTQEQVCEVSITKKSSGLSDLNCVCKKKLLKIIQQLFIQYYHFVSYFTICAEIKTKCHYKYKYQSCNYDCM